LEAALPPRVALLPVLVLLLLVLLFAA